MLSRFSHGLDGNLAYFTAPVRVWNRRQGHECCEPGDFSQVFGAASLHPPTAPDPGSLRGNLTFIEAEGHIPFDIKRVYYIYDVPGGSSRGGHAHKQLQQLIIAMAGSFDVTP